MATTEQLKGELEAAKQMLGEYAMRMSPILGDSDPVNAYLCQQYEKCETKIDRLQRTLAVREEASRWRSA